MYILAYIQTNTCIHTYMRKSFAINGSHVPVGARVFLYYSDNFEKEIIVIRSGPDFDFLHLLNRVERHLGAFDSRLKYLLLLFHFGDNACISALQFGKIFGAYLLAC